MSFFHKIAASFLDLLALVQWEKGWSLTACFNIEIPSHQSVICRTVDKYVNKLLNMIMTSCTTHHTKHSFYSVVSDYIMLNIGIQKSEPTCHFGIFW